METCKSKLVRPKRSKHCDVCNSCVMVYDHHCPWINNCVGANNHFVFYLFLVSLLFEFILQFVMQSIHLTSNTCYRMVAGQPHCPSAVILGKYITFGYVIIYCCLFSIPLG